LLEPGIEPGTSCSQNGCVTTAPTSQLKVSIVVKLFNYFDAVGQNTDLKDTGIASCCIQHGLRPVVRVHKCQWYAKQLLEPPMTNHMLLFVPCKAQIHRSIFPKNQNKSQFSGDNLWVGSPVFYYYVMFAD